jgi:hypothetical protein
MKVIFAALFVGWLVSLSAFGQEKEAKIPDPFAAASKDSTPKNISVQLELIEMSHKDLTRLLMEHKFKSADASALRMKVQEMVEKDLAKVMETKMVTNRSGQISNTESIREFVYPVDYDLSPTPSVEGSTDPLNHPVTPFGIPNCYETRNTGSTFEVVTNLGEDNKIIDVKIVSQQVWHTGENIWCELKDKIGNVYKNTSQDFYKIGIDTSVTVVSGQYFLLGVVSPKDAKGKLDSERKVMAFLKCDVLSVAP